MTSPDIKDHVVLVAGAASGIGREIAKNLIAKGAIVAACDKNLAALKSLRDELANQSLHTFGIDFLSDASIKECVDEVESKLGPLKAAINCVGVLGKNGERVELIDLDDFDLVYRINLRGALVFTKMIIGGMAARGYGRILHLSSISGKEGNPLLVAYSATKAGLIGLVKSVGKEY
ncbi:MAG: SDR family NAD(P)-dependent oxidoreductase, partial [Actinomycetota bacterium]